MESLHISVGTYPHTQLTLQQELRLVKAALLYADKVTLYSLQATAILMASKAGTLSLEHQLSVIEQVAPYIGSQPGGANVSRLLSSFKQKKYLSGKELILKKQMEAQVVKEWRNILQVSEELATNAGLPQLQYAIKEGILEVHRFQRLDGERAIAEFIADCVIKASQVGRASRYHQKLDEDTDRIIREFFQLVSSAVCSGHTFPLFDESTGDLVRLGIKEQKIDVKDTMLQRAKHTPLAASLLERLPLFDDATMDVVIDVRQELEKPLIRFRKAMIEFSASISSAPWDRDFPAEADMIFHEKVAPAVLEIEDAVLTNASIGSLLGKTARKLVDKPLVLPAGSALALALSNVANLPQEVAAALGLGASTAALVFDAYNEWKQQRDVVERNALYFYYRAQKHFDRFVA